MKRLPKRHPPGADKGGWVKYVYAEETLQKALCEIKSGTLDLKAAVKKYGIPYTMIIGHLKGCKE